MMNVIMLMGVDSNLFYKLSSKRRSLPGAFLDVLLVQVYNV